MVWLSDWLCDRRNVFSLCTYSNTVTNRIYTNSGGLGSEANRRSRKSSLIKLLAFGFIKQINCVLLNPLLVVSSALAVSIEIARRVLFTVISGKTVVLNAKVASTDHK